MRRLILLIVGIIQLLTCTALAYTPNGENADFGGVYKMKLPNDFQRQLTYYPGYIQIGDKVFDLVEIRDSISKESDSEDVITVGTVQRGEDGRLLLRLNFAAEAKYSCDHNCGTKRRYEANNKNYEYAISGGEGVLTLQALNDEGGLPLVMSAEGSYVRNQRELYALTDITTIYALETIPQAMYPGWLMQAWRNHYQYELDWATDYYFSKMSEIERAAGRDYRGGMVVTVFDEQGELLDSLTTDSFAEHIYRINKDKTLSLVADRRIE